MIDEQRAAQWTNDAKTALMQHYGKDEEIARFASITLALLADREEREHYIQRSIDQEQR